MSIRDYFNDEQNAYLDNLPYGNRCACGWFTMEVCMSGKGCSPECTTEERRRAEYKRCGKPYPVEETDEIK